MMRLAKCIVLYFHSDVGIYGDPFDHTGDLFRCTLVDQQSGLLVLDGVDARCDDRRFGDHRLQKGESLGFDSAICRSPGGSDEDIGRCQIPSAAVRMSRYRFCCLSLS
jgi:hypothetical protein